MIGEAFFIFFGIILQVFIPGFPKETLLFQSGATFGLILGSILNWISMIVAAQVAYEIVRRSVETGGRFSTLLEEYSSSKLVIYVQENGNRGLFVIRLIPNSPNDVMSLIAGGLFLPRKGYAIVSTITAIPYAIAFAYLGTVGRNFIDTSTLMLFNFVLLLLVGFVYLIKRRSKFAVLDGQITAKEQEQLNTFD